MGDLVAFLDDEDVREVDGLCWGLVFVLLLEGEEVVLGYHAPPAEGRRDVPAPGLEDSGLFLEEALVQDAAQLLLELLLADRHLLLISQPYQCRDNTMSMIKAGKGWKGNDNMR